MAATKRGEASAAAASGDAACVVDEDVDTAVTVDSGA